MLRRFCFEPLHKLVKRAHQRGLKVFFHTDGHVMNILPLFVEFGIDGINPFQVSAGNSFETLRDEYGGKLMLYGGIDNCFIIPDGTVEDVRAHIRHLFETLGQTGGLIASSHDIPSHVPLENLDAMVEAIKACRY
jgi:uroporphyrinogen decarboxylase